MFKIDPAGTFLPYKATATGKSEQEAMNFLEKRVNEFGEMNENDTIEAAISTMQHILSTDFKAAEIEIGVVTLGQKFKLLNDVEVEQRLNSIQAKAEA